MYNQNKLSNIDFINAKHYGLYLKGKTKQTWDSNLNWNLAGRDLIPENLKTEVDAAFEKLAAGESQFLSGQTGPVVCECQCCGHKILEMPLKERLWSCPACGVEYVEISM